MGDSVKIVCLACPKEPAPIEVINGKRKRSSREEFMNSCKNDLWIGRGIENAQNRLPGYCNTCQKIVTVKAEKPYCNICNSIVQLSGTFIFQHRNKYKGFTDFHYPERFVYNNLLGLNKESILKNSKLTLFQKILLKIRPNKFQLIFKLDFKRKYYCTTCKTTNLKISPGFIMWD